MKRQGIVSRVIRAVLSYFDDSAPESPDARTAVREMRKEVRLKAESVTVAMTRADELREQLEAAVADARAHEQNTADFLKSGERELAERCVALKLQAESTVARLAQRVKDAQESAEAALRELRDLQTQVQVREQQIPELEHDERYVRALERVEAEQEKRGGDSAVLQFDRVASELRINERRLRNRELIAADPSAIMDRQIREIVGERKVKEALAEIEHKLASGSTVIEGEVVNDADPVADAQRLLSAPRYEGLLLLPGRSRSGVPRFDKGRS